MILPGFFHENKILIFKILVFHRFYWFCTKSSVIWKHWYGMDSWVWKKVDFCAQSFNCPECSYCADLNDVQWCCIRTDIGVFLCVVYWEQCWLSDSRWKEGPAVSFIHTLQENQPVTEGATQRCQSVLQRMRDIRELLQVTSWCSCVWCLSYKWWRGKLCQMHHAWATPQGNRAFQSFYSTKIFMTVALLCAKSKTHTSSWS